ncbi:MAG: glutamate synthase subunit beta [Firmicutes bacterium]|nr:glutamate synthase subunit beta [Bacillota bacterium]
MGKPTGFLEYQRENSHALSPEERIKNFDEFKTPVKPDERRRQAARCMNCGVPFCQAGATFAGMVSGCPLHNLIPEWNDELYNGNMKPALDRLLKTNNFPEFTGRVCPALCEVGCVNGLYGDSVTVHDNELYIIEEGYKNGWMTPHPPAVRSGKRVAVVGSGPSGLAAADSLNRRGHSVTVYERDERPGGLLMYGIPNMKLDKRVIERRINLMKGEGVDFRTNVNVGVDITADELTGEYDAVILACGAKRPRDLNVEGRDAEGVYFAVDFLSAATRHVIGDESEFSVSAEGKDVIIIGGGDTGNDCVGTSIRQGCRSVTQLEMMPKSPDTRAEDNPWPQWPKVCKVDYGQEEAIALYGHDPRIYKTTVKEIRKDENGRISSVVTVSLTPEKDPNTGRTNMVPVAGSEAEMPCGLLLIAAGFLGCENYVAEAFGANLTPRGVIATDAGSYGTSVPGVFTAGDAHRGQSLVVWAISEGRGAAKEADEYLMGYTNII